MKNTFLHSEALVCKIINVINNQAARVPFVGESMRFDAEVYEKIMSLCSECFEIHQSFINKVPMKNKRSFPT